MIKVRARHVVTRDRLRRCVCALVLQEIEEHMRVRAVGTFAVRRRNGLIDLGAGQRRDEYTMRTVLKGSDLRPGPRGENVGFPHSARN